MVASNEPDALGNLHLLEQKLGHFFGNRSLLVTALTHSGYANSRPVPEHNERLEFLGDQVLGLYVTAELFRAFPEADEGRLSQMRSVAVCGENLAGFSMELELKDHLLLHPNEKAKPPEKLANVLVDALEALIGAIYLDSADDGKDETLRLLIKRILERSAKSLFPSDASSLPTLKPEHAKSRLNELLAKLRLESWEYREASVSGPDHQKTYRMEFLAEGRVIGTGTAGSKKEAERIAARKAVEKLESFPAGRGKARTGNGRNGGERKERPNEKKRRTE